MCAYLIQPTGMMLKQSSIIDLWLYMETESSRDTCTHVVESCIHRHQMSKDFWTPVIDEVLVCIQESENPHDPYAVAVKKGSLVVGHIPRKFQLLAHCFYGLPVELLQLP